MSPRLQIERTPLASGWLETWTLNDPARRNALNADLVAQLQAACLRASADTQLRGVVLRGAGGQFCAGGSLEGFAQAIGQPQAAGEADPLVALNRDFGALLQSLSALPQWLIVAVQGAAMGGGVGLLACADCVIAHSGAQLATPEVTLGLVPAQIAPFVLRRAGPNARRWLLSGERLTAHEAQQLGLVDAVADDLDAALHAAVQRHAQAAPAAVAATKRLLHAPVPETLLQSAAHAFAAALRSPEAAQGLAAFAARQPAPWAEPRGHCV